MDNFWFYAVLGLLALNTVSAAGTAVAALGTEMMRADAALARRRYEDERAECARLRAMLRRLKAARDEKTPQPAA